MENKKEEVKQPSQDVNNELLKQVLRMNQELSELKAANNQKVEDNQRLNNSYSPDLHNMNLKVYSNGSSFKVNPQEESEESQKTISQLKEEAKNAMIQERNNFLSNQMYGDAVSKSYSHGNNKRYYHECAFINIYEQADESFREIVGPKIEMLKKGDYWGLLNSHIQEEEALKNAYRGIEGEWFNRVSEKQSKLANLTRNLIHRYSHFANI